jgi:hypothetical protein
MSRTDEVSYQNAFEGTAKRKDLQVTTWEKRKKINYLVSRSDLELVINGNDCVMNNYAGKDVAQENKWELIAVKVNFSAIISKLKINNLKFKNFYNLPRS